MTVEWATETFHRMMMMMMMMIIIIIIIIKTAILGTSHIIRKVLQCEAWSVSGGDHRCFKRSTGKKRPVTRDIHIEYNNNNNNKPDTDELCRRCGKESETIQHITAACQHLAPTAYVKRHDGLAKIIHQKVAEAAELIDDKSPHYKYTPFNVLENENFKLYWNRRILTDKTIPFNRPDITLMYK